MMQADNKPNPAKGSQPPRDVSRNLSLRLARLPKKEALLKLGVWLVIVGIAVAIWKWPAKNTIPADIRRQTNFHTIFPTKNYDPNSFQYSASKHSLQFKVRQDGIGVIVNELLLPPNLAADPSKDPSAMLNSLGVHYYEQTQTKLGVVSVAKFWTNNYLPYGQTAILGKDNALVLARSDKDISLSQWTALFASFSQ